MIGDGMGNSGQKLWEILEGIISKTENIRLNRNNFMEFYRLGVAIAIVDYGYVLLVY